MGGVTGAAIFFLPFAAGGLGAGDVKLVAGLGAWLGWQDGMAGSVYGPQVRSGYRGCPCDRVLRQAVSNVWLLLMHWLSPACSPPG